MSETPTKSADSAEPEVNQRDVLYRHCPFCHAVNKRNEGNYCVECGIHRESGARLPRGGRHSGLQAPVLALLGGTALCAVLLVSTNNRSDAFPAPDLTLAAATVARSTPPRPENPVRPTPLPEKPPVTPPEVLPPPDTNPPTPTEGIDKPSPPEPTPHVPDKPRVDLAKLKREIVERLTLEMDRKYPLLRTGRIVKLRMRDGSERSGVLNYIATDNLMLNTDRGRERIRFEDLDNAFKVRCDTAYRARWIEDRAYREMLKSTDL